MNKLVIAATTLVGTISLSSFGWGLDDALKTVDKTTEVVNKADAAVKEVETSVRNVTQTPQEISAQKKEAAQSTVRGEVRAVTPERSVASAPVVESPADNNVPVLPYAERATIKNSCQEKIQNAYYGKHISDAQRMSFEMELSRFDGASVKMTRKEADDYCADLDQRLEKSKADLAAAQQAAAEKRAAAEKQAEAERQAAAERRMMAEKQAADAKRAAAEKQAASERHLAAVENADTDTAIGSKKEVAAMSQAGNRSARADDINARIPREREKPVKNADLYAGSADPDWIWTECYNEIRDAYPEFGLIKPEVIKLNKAFYGREDDQMKLYGAKLIISGEQALQYKKDLFDRLKGIKAATKLERELETVLTQEFSQEQMISYEEKEKIKKDALSYRDKEESDTYVKRLEDLVKNHSEAIAKKKEMRETLGKKTEAALKYVEEQCSRDEYIRGDGCFTAEHKQEILKLLNGITQAQLAMLVRERDDVMLFVAVQLITDQKVLEDLLVTNTKWVKGGYRDGMFASDFRHAYYQLYKNVTDQDLLLKLLKQDEISFSTESSRCYGYRTPAVLRQLDKEHLDILNRQRIARRRAAHGKTIDVMGFYIGMPRQDFELLMFMRKLTDKDATGSFGTFGRGAADRIWLGHKYNANFMEIVKDGIVGMSVFTSRFVPGGEENAGEIHLNGDVKDTYDIANEEVGVRVDTFWWRTCPKLGCKIKLYDGGNIVIESDEKDVKLDLSEAEKWMNDDFDETELDADSVESSGGVMSFIIILAVIGSGLYFARKKIDALVAKNPKFEKVWSVLCAVGRGIKAVTMMVCRFVVEKYRDYKNKKAKA